MHAIEVSEVFFSLKAQGMFGSSFFEYFQAPYFCCCGKMDLCVSLGKALVVLQLPFEILKRVRMLSVKVS